MSKQELEVKKQNEVALFAGFEEDAEAGFESASATDYAIPFLRVLQKMSPQVDKSDGAYVDGAEPGMLIDTVTLETFETVNVVPVCFHKSVLLWKPRDEGGGFKGEISIAEAEKLLGCSLKNAPRNDKGKTLHPTENVEMDETALHYVLILKDVGFAPAVMALSSSQLKNSRRWMSVMQQLKFPRSDGSGVFTPPMWASVFSVKTTQEENEKGKWFGLDIRREGNNEDAVVATEAKKFRDAITKGEVTKVDPNDTTSSDYDDDVGF